TLTPEEKDLVWKFRFYLTREKRALTKFLKCVVWTDSIEVRQAVDLLPLWADINVDDALELLGKDFENKSVRSYAVNQLRKADDDDLLLYLLQLVQALKFEFVEDKDAEFDNSSLLQFLIDRAIKNHVLGTYFYWYLMVELQDLQDLNNRKLYAKVAFRYFQDLLQIDHFRSRLNDPKKPILKVNPLQLLLDPSKDIVGIDPAKSTIFNSSLAPLKICFLCKDNTEYPIIFKYGDDLRQDQLVIQIISLMDRLLLKENLDLKLTPYKVMATGPDQGMMQFIPSQSLAAVLNDHQNNVLSFFRQHHPSNVPGSVYGIDPKVMETYTRSCGVGDRHLDNLLLSPDGHLFHVDFGFILGRDPKPFPPPMKLCKEMIEAMGGANSPHYAQFQQYCYTAFTTLRRNANLILNLFSLMVDANITDIKNEPEKAVMKVQEKFRLDLTEEAAIAYFRGLISESVNALFPQIMETVHKWAQYWRR
ncbi:Phosphatidylinositol (PI) 3-kinase, partial [Rhizopus stolonifer]